MKLIALCLLRNESWCIGASLRAALRWVDGAAILLDRCVDDTEAIVERAIRESGKVCIVSRTDSAEHWQEMNQRQRNLDDARKLGATHLAIVDGDEILTHNNLPYVRGWFEGLKEGDALDVPMIAPWGDLFSYCPNTAGVITLGFKDSMAAGWAPRGAEKYDHHSRPPHGTKRRVTKACEGGVFHLQFAAKERMVWKHRHYMMSEIIRWGYPTREINERYHWWAKDPHGAHLKVIPPEWFGDYQKDLIDLNATAWYEPECKAMVQRYGAHRFSGLDLFGWHP